MGRAAIVGPGDREQLGRASIDSNELFIDISSQILDLPRSY